MRQSYRDKRNRQARIAQEKMEAYEDRRKEQRRKKDRRQDERRSGDDRRKVERRATPRNGFDRRIGERRADTDRRFVERRSGEDRRQNDEISEYEDIVAGRNAVLELLKSDKDINKIYVERGEKHGSINEIIARARAERIVLVEVDTEKLNTMAENHQGVVAVVPPFNYCEIEEILELAKNKNEDPFIIILDGIEDPHNFGSIIRTAETAGVHGIIIPKRRAATVNSTVYKVSAGAVEHMKIARVNNLNDTIKELKEAGLWICGTDMDTDTYYDKQDLTGPIGVVIGSEGEGMSRIVKESCDFLVRIPMIGSVQSLNASVAAGVIMYEILRQRGENI
jgi:23S rRNA (guanosine2251-2'-O)-methyltransferase